MAKLFCRFNDPTVTGKTQADMTVVFCNDIDGGAIDTTGYTLTETAAGSCEYIIYNPNVTTKRVRMKIRLTTDATRYISVTFDPADGDVAKDSTVAKDATVMKAADYTAPDNAGISANGAAIGSVAAKLDALAAQETEEYIEVEDDIVRDSDGYKTSCVIYRYDNAAHATTHDKATGLVGHDHVTIAYDANKRMTLFKRIPG